MGNAFEVWEGLSMRLGLCGALLVSGIVRTASPLPNGKMSTAPVERGEVEQWLKETTAISKALKMDRINVTAWQDKMEALNRTLSYPKLLKFLNFDQLVQKIKYPKDIAAAREIHFPQVPGLPAKLFFEPRMFAYRRGATSPTRAHNNMVSAHLVLKGSFRVRTFQRVRDEANAIWLRPSMDKEILEGDIITMSDDRDNAHSFVATSDHAYILEIPVSQVNLNKRYMLKADEYSEIYADPSGKPAADGLIRAPVVEFEEALKRFSGT